MTDTPPQSGLRLGAAAVTYWLPEGASPALSMGADVGAGDIIATIPAPPTVVALGDALRRNADASMRIVESLHGTPITDGQALATYRSGLRQRAVRATATGIALAVPASGAILVRPVDASAAVHAQHPGTIIAIEQDRVVVATPVYRIGFAFGVGAAWRAAVVSRAAPGAHRMAGAAHGDAHPAQEATIVAYIDDDSTITTDRRDAAPVIAGAISDDAAWRLLTRAGKANERDGKARSLIVLDGPGDATRGERAIRPLLALAGASIVMDREAREIIIFADDDFPTRREEPADGAPEGAGVYTDPGRWQEACTVRGTPYIAMLATGVRTLVVRTTRRTGIDESTPVSNLDMRSKL
jgi:hypothetical protein